MYSPLQQSPKTCVGKDTFVFGSTRAYVPEENVKDLKTLEKLLSIMYFTDVFTKKIMLFSKEYKPER